MGAAALHRYWIKFVGPAPTGFQLGCGVTALSERDARAIVMDLFQDGSPPIASIESDIDVSLLDANHVLPNMGDCTQRGVWFPKLGR